jgi:uncharacterized protein (TIRG00374 family)
MTRRKKGIWFLISTVILGALIYVSDYNELISVVAESDLSYVLFAVASGCFTLFIWGSVWHQFFDYFEINVEFSRSLHLLLAGTFFNFVTPLGRFGGEPIVAHLISERTNSTYSQALSSVTSADLSNSLPFLTAAVVSVLYLALFEKPTLFTRNIVFIVLFFVIGWFLVIYLLWFGRIKLFSQYSHKIGQLVPTFGKLSPYIQLIKSKISTTITKMQKVGENPYKIFFILIISHLAILGHIGGLYFALLSVNVEPIPHAVFIIISLSTFLTFSPTPGSIGTFEAGFAGLLLIFFPISTATATAIAIVYRVGTYLPGLILGYLSIITLESIDE